MSPEDTDTPTDSALPEIRGRWWPCVCTKPEHAVFLPSDQRPASRHGTYQDTDDKGRDTVVTYWRIATPRCAKALGTAPAAALPKAPRRGAAAHPQGGAGGAKPTVIDVREAGAA